MKVLLTGASGFIGSRLVESLRAQGSVVETVTRLATNEHAAESTSTGWSVVWPSGLASVDFSEYDAVVHLAIPRGSFKSHEDEASLHSSALSCLLAGIAATNPKCRLVFLSSQSATSQAVSGYGRGKWECEEMLRQSKIPSSILRPGLVVARDNPSGLCGAIVKTARFSPLVPVPHCRSLTVQPVDVTDVVRGIEAVLRTPANPSASEIEMALSPRSLPDLVRDLCWELQMHRLVIPIPFGLASACLAVAERLIPGLPFGRENLRGLRFGKLIEETAWRDNLLPCPREFGLPKPHWSTEAKKLWEARFLSRWFFKTEPTPRMIERYLRAHQEIPQLQPGPLSDLAAFSTNGLLVEAAERVTRSAQSPLTAKIQVLSYSAEIEPSLRDRFLLDQPSRASGWVSLSLYGIYTGVLLMIGVILLWTGKIAKCNRSRSARAA